MPYCNLQRGGDHGGRGCDDGDHVPLILVVFFTHFYDYFLNCKMYIYLLIY